MPGRTEFGSLLAALLKPYTHHQRKVVISIKEPEVKELKRMNLNVPIELHNNFKSAVAAQGEKMTDVLLRHIEKYVREHGQAHSKKKGKRG